MSSLIQDSATKEEVTLLVSDISYAIKKDHEQQKKEGFKVGRFSLNLYHDLLEKFYPRPNKGNATILRTARATAKKLRDGTRSDESVVSSEDAQRLAKLLFVTLGMYGWPHTREVIKKAGPKFAGLLTLNPPPLDAQTKIDHLRLPDQGSEGVPLSTMLQQYAAEVAKLEVALEKERKVKAETAESLVDAVNENRMLSVMITRINDLIKKVDTSQDEQLKQEIKSFKLFIESVNK